MLILYWHYVLDNVCVEGHSLHCKMLIASLDSIPLCQAQMLSDIAKNLEDWKVEGVKLTLVGNQWSIINSTFFIVPDFSSETFPLEIILDYIYLNVTLYLPFSLNLYLSKSLFLPLPVLTYLTYCIFSLSYIKAIVWTLNDFKIQRASIWEQSLEPSKRTF